MSTRIGVGVSDEPEALPAFAAAAADAARGLDGSPCDLVIVFAASDHLESGAGIMATVEGELRPRAMIGCGAGGVVGGGLELEHGPGAVVWALSAPGAEIETHALTTEPVDGGIALAGLPDDPDDYGETMIVLTDPASFSTEALLKHLTESRPGMPVLGGMASAALPGGASLFLNGEVVDRGAVAVSLAGVQVLPCVSQGATPVGPEMTITAVEGNTITELASQPALERVKEAIESLESEERDLAGAGLLVGIVIDENQPDYLRGDFLVRPVVSADPEANTIIVANRVRVGQIVRLQVRDRVSAEEDLREALAIQAQALGSDGAAGALLFTCNGRGAHMFGRSGHDAEAVEDAIGAPAGGFFCAGEIGPVGGRNFVHGFTATLAVFPKD
ncbi:FIST N-terminal domain-containing protein [soil metagenome]